MQGTSRQLIPHRDELPAFELHGRWVTEITAGAILGNQERLRPWILWRRNGSVLPCAVRWDDPRRAPQEPGAALSPERRYHRKSDRLDSGTADGWTQRTPTLQRAVSLLARFASSAACSAHIAAWILNFAYDFHHFDGYILAIGPVAQYSEGILPAVDICPERFLRHGLHLPVSARRVHSEGALAQRVAGARSRANQNRNRGCLQVRFWGLLPPRPAAEP